MFGHIDLCLSFFNIQINLCTALAFHRFVFIYLFVCFHFDMEIYRLDLIINRERKVYIQIANHQLFVSSRHDRHTQKVHQSKLKNYINKKFLLLFSFCVENITII